MFGYATVGSNRIDEARAFYDDLLESIGMAPLVDHPSGGRVYGDPRKTMFGVLGPYDGGEASPSNGAMSGFRFDLSEQVDAFHARALRLGATCDGPPGPRGPEQMGLYFGYFRDLDGNKLCGFKWG